MDCMLRRLDEWSEGDVIGILQILVIVLTSRCGYLSYTCSIYCHDYYMLLELDILRE